MNDELYKQYEKMMLENGMPQDLIFKTFKELAETNMFFNHKMELQSYKDKEDKIREILKYEYSDAILGRFGRDLKYGLLQILNEGDK